jgi:branched-chain amino acid transport system substrate-binding protein
MKKIWIGILIVIIVALATALIIAQPKKESEEIKIGAVLPLTGPSGYIGEAIKNGMILALDETSNNKTKSEIIFEDSKGETKIGVNAFKKLTESDNINICVAALSSVVNPIIPLADNKQIPLIATVVSAEGIAKKSSWVFRFFTKAEIDAKVMAEYAYKSLNLKEIVILHVQDDFGISYAKIFKQVFENLGGKVVGVENFQFGESDFRTVLSKIKSFKFDGVYILSYANNLAIIPKQMKELGIKATILSIGTIAQDFVIKQAPDAIEGIYYTTTAFDISNPATDEMKKFVTLYKEKFNQNPEYFEVFGYDIAKIISQIVRNTGSDEKEIRDSLLALHGYKGAAGEISVDKSGEINFPVVIKRVVDGQPSEPLLTISP